MCNEALNGGGVLDVYLGAMILSTYMSVHLYIVRRMLEYLRDTCRKLNVLIQVLIVP